MSKSALQVTEPASALSEDEFAAFVKQALRTLHQPQELLRNPLLASTMVQTALRQDSDGRPDVILRRLILEAACVLKSDPRADNLYRVRRPHLPAPGADPREGGRVARPAVQHLSPAPRPRD